MRFFIPERLLQRRVNVWLIGVGGTGSELLERLARLHLALLALGHPGGLQVTAFDGDTVSDANIGRQRFWPADVGHNKAVVAIHRLNLFLGLDWSAHALDFEVSVEQRWISWPDLLITCVDRAAVRVAIGRVGARSCFDSLWLDTGNGRDTGQVILGHLCDRPQDRLRLPSVYDLYGRELSDPRLDADDQPSCGLAAALGRQSLFINALLADLGAALLYELFTSGVLEHHGYLVDLKSGVVPLKIDAAAWAFMGYGDALIPPAEPSNLQPARA